MQRSDFAYHLPDELIAQAPLPNRSDARLLTLDGSDGRVSDRAIVDLPELLGADDLLIFNDTRVVPARLYGRKASGGRVELLLERALDERRVLAQMKVSKPPARGAVITVEGGAEVEVGERKEGGLVEFVFDRPALAHFEAHGHMPLPPYVQRADDDQDRERYQTVFADKPGAVAAPTAGLHFDEALLGALDAQGIERRTLTLHVGAGTFQPVRVDDLDNHVMHEEQVLIDEGLREAIATCWARGGQVVAVGTTVVRGLESAAGSDGLPQAGARSTRLFIRPGGHRFATVDRMLTNFHLPESTLLMLVCAYAGTDHTLAAYTHAVRERYRFFSYGDAMLVSPQASQRRERRAG
ncbi:MAG: tRNA preQ1(34) S-adenosylmethionine ribosyltransferase-isomerase QueA [Pseudomonadota bacterium]